MWYQIIDSQKNDIMKKQILIALTTAFAVLIFLGSCTNAAEKSTLQEPTTQTETVAPLPKDTAINVQPASMTAEKGEKEEREEKDEDEAAEKKK